MKGRRGSKGKESSDTSNREAAVEASGKAEAPAQPGAEVDNETRNRPGFRFDDPDEPWTPPEIPTDTESPMCEKSGVGVIGSCLSGTGVWGYGDVGVRATGSRSGGSSSTGIGVVAEGGGYGVFAWTALGIGVKSVSGTTAPDRAAVYGENRSTGTGVLGQSVGGAGVLGQSGSATAVKGESSTTAPDHAAVHGENKSTGTGVLGKSSAGTGVLGQSSTGTAVKGESGTTASDGAAVHGLNKSGGTGVLGQSSSGTGIFGSTTAGIGVFGLSSVGTGVRGQSNTAGAVGVHGVDNSRDFGGTGVLGESKIGTGVKGESRTITPGSAAVHGLNKSAGTGVLGQSSTGTGIFGSTTAGTGVRGESSKGAGILGISNEGTGVQGATNNANGTAVYGENNSKGGWGVQGVSRAGGIGVQGTSGTGIGVWGICNEGTGVQGVTNTANSTAVYGENMSQGGWGVQGVSRAGGIGVQGTSGTSIGVFGVSDTNSGVQGHSNSYFGVWGSSSASHGIVASTASSQHAGLHAYNTGGGHGVSGECTAPEDKSNPRAAVYGINTATPRGYAGYFLGLVYASSTIQAPTVTHTIDHPRDPENKYLNMSAVASPDLLTIYNGIVTTDDDGAANVALPDYVEALNRDFCYQLTVIGTFAQAIISREVEDNAFSIKTDKPNVRVCWQVTGTRKDPFAEQNRVQTVEHKSDDQRGYYLHPEAYGLPGSQGIHRELLARSNNVPESSLPEIKDLPDGAES